MLSEAFSTFSLLCLFLFLLLFLFLFLYPLLFLYLTRLPPKARTASSIILPGPRITVLLTTMIDGNRTCDTSPHELGTP